MGTGITRMRNWMAEAGLKPPKFTFTTFFTVIFPRPVQVTKTPTVGANQRSRDAVDDAISDTISEGINEGISEGIRERLAWIVEQTLVAGSITRRDIERQFSVSRQTVERYIALLKRANLLSLEGARKTGTYVLTDKGKALLKESGK
jgi:ATP-dependent DNA helicase RecG